MRKGIFTIAGLIGIIAAVYVVMRFTYIGQGQVGVVWSMKDGVKEEVLSPGAHFVGPFDKVKEYPVSQQQIVFSNNPGDYNKDEHDDWHIDAPADGGMVKMNLVLNYSFMADRVTGLYAKFNGMDGESIVENMVQNSIIAYVKEVTPQFSVMDIYSTKRSEVSQAITEYLSEKLGREYGINVVSALIIDVQLDSELQAKIQAKEQAKQDAEKAELDKQTALAQAEVDKVNAETAAAVAVEKAKGAAEVKKIEAEAEAERVKIDAQAQAEANNTISQSITPELIQMEEMEARKIHGWVTVSGGTAVVDQKSE